MTLWGPQIPSLGPVPLFPGAWDGRGPGSRGQSRERPGRVYREASISQGLLLSEFRIKGLRREEVQRKWDVGHLVKRAVRAPRAWVLTLFPASAERRPGRHLSHQRRGPPGAWPGRRRSCASTWTSGCLEESLKKRFLTWAWRDLRPGIKSQHVWGLGEVGGLEGAFDLMMCGLSFPPLS